MIYKREHGSCGLGNREENGTPGPARQKEEETPLLLPPPAALTKGTNLIQFGQC